jgi:hypothetical protein
MQTVHKQRAKTVSMLTSIYLLNLLVLQLTQQPETYNPFQQVGQATIQQLLRKETLQVELWVPICGKLLPATSHRLISHQATVLLSQHLTPQKTGPNFQQ